ncbi:MAG: PARP-type zinc finger-containing protein [Candidatus Thorarchaeota archaeon]
MTDWIQYDADWAYYVDPETFEMPKARSKVPIESIVLEKRRETIDTGMTVVVTTYKLTRDEGLVALEGKKEASALLTKQLLDFMRKRGTFAPGTSIKKTYNNRNVDIQYIGSDYDKFILRFTPAIVGGDPEEFLMTLGEPGRLKFNPEDAWKIEPATSGRASCKTCNGTIPKGSLRIGEPTYFQDHLNYKWHHFDCISDDIWGIPEEKLSGYASLSAEHKTTVKEKLWE